MKVGVISMLKCFFYDFAYDLVQNEFPSWLSRKLDITYYTQVTRIYVIRFDDQYIDVRENIYYWHL